jgi:hypothetical protein
MALNRALRDLGPVRAIARAVALVVAFAAVCLNLSTALGTAAPIPATFEASIGLTRSQVEARFLEIDGSQTSFKSAPSIAGVPRVLGQDRKLFTAIEVNGYPEVVDVQLVSVLDTQSKTTLENQVVYDSLACGLLAEMVAQKWCTGRILNTGSRGLITATASKTFGPLRITVKTYQAAKASSPPVVSVNVTAM